MLRNGHCFQVGGRYGRRLHLCTGCSPCSVRLILGGNRVTELQVLERMNDARWGVWQILDVGSIWMREFGSALGKQCPTVAWLPKMSRVGALRRRERIVQVEEPALIIREFPLQRGYAREAIRRLMRFEDRILQRLEIASGGEPERSPLICSTPFYAPVAERWAGPVVYYSTDLTAKYEGIDSTQVRDLDRRMCSVAAAVCPNSERIAEYFMEEAACDPAKITVIPNATREANIAPSALLQPGSLPHDVRDIPRPIAGVIGDLSGNMDWSLIAAAMEGTPGLNWVFVGPTSRTIQDREQNSGRERVMRGRARFVGPKPYGELQSYARSFDVAILPYRKKEPTYSGSSTRFYEHLAACRPMVATRGFAELMEKVPLVTLVDTGLEMSAALCELEAKGFSDGLESVRWEASRAGTWETRSLSLQRTLGQR